MDKGGGGEGMARVQILCKFSGNMPIYQDLQNLFSKTSLKKFKRFERKNIQKTQKVSPLFLLYNLLRHTSGPNCTKNVERILIS